MKESAYTKLEREFLHLQERSLDLIRDYDRDLTDAHEKLANAIVNLHRVSKLPDGEAQELALAVYMMLTEQADEH